MANETPNPIIARTVAEALAYEKHLQTKHDRLLDENRRAKGEHRLLEAYFAFTDVLMADQYLPPERKIDIMKALNSAWPTPEEYAVLPWQPGLPSDDDDDEGESQ